MRYLDLLRNVVYLLTKREMGGRGGKPGGRGGRLGELVRFLHTNLFLEWIRFFFLKTRGIEDRGVQRE
jgi:hypothetical protein